MLSAPTETATGLPELLAANLSAFRNHAAVFSSLDKKTRRGYLLALVNTQQAFTLSYDPSLIDEGQVHRLADVCDTHFNAIASKIYELRGEKDAQSNILDWATSHLETLKDLDLAIALGMLMLFYDARLELRKSVVEGELVDRFKQSEGVLLVDFKDQVDRILSDPFRQISVLHNFLLGELRSYHAKPAAQLAIIEAYTEVVASHSDGAEILKILRDAVEPIRDRDRSVAPVHKLPDAPPPKPPPASGASDQTSAT